MNYEEVTKAPKLKVVAGKFAVYSPVDKDFVSVLMVTSDGSCIRRVAFTFGK